MPQIEIPFTPGQRVRTKDGRELGVFSVIVTRGGFTVVDDEGLERDASDLTLVEPVIEWAQGAMGWSSPQGWFADDDGSLRFLRRFIGTFPDPRAVAEATQKMWNKARRG